MSGRQREWHSDKKYVSPLLQPPLNRLFIARPPLDSPSADSKDPRHIPDKPRLSPACQYLSAEPLAPPPPPKPSLEERQSMRRAKAVEKAQKKSDGHGRLEFKPLAASSDPFRTVFVARLPYDCNERRLKREFERYGAIKSIAIVEKRGYAFVEYERERDAKTAYHEADSTTFPTEVEPRRRSRILVDFERGRTVKGWLPRRLGGGLGLTRAGPVSACHRSRERQTAGASAHVGRRPSVTLPPPPAQDSRDRQKRQDTVPSEPTAKVPRADDTTRHRVQYDDIY